MIASCIYKEDGMEDLLRKVGIHCGGDVGNAAEVAINEFTQTRVIFHGAVSAAPPTNSSAGQAERILRIDQQKGDRSLEVETGSRLC